jgi:hypothetical protein
MKNLFLIVLLYITIQLTGCSSSSYNFSTISQKNSNLYNSSLFHVLQSIEEQLAMSNTTSAGTNIIAAGYPVEHIKSGNDSVTIVALGKAKYHQGSNSSSYTTRSYMQSGIGNGCWTTTTNYTPARPAFVSIEPTKEYFGYNYKLPILKTFRLIPPKMEPCFYYFTGVISPNTMEYNNKNSHIITPGIQDGKMDSNSEEFGIMKHGSYTAGFNVPDIPLHLKNLSMSPVFIMNKWYSLDRPFAMVPGDLRLSIDLRKTIELYTIFSSGYPGNDDYKFKTDAARMLSWLNAYALTLRADKYNLGDSTIIFCGIDSKNIFFRKTTQRAYELYREASDCDSNWCYPKEKASEMLRRLSDSLITDSVKNTSTTLSKRRWRIGMCARVAGMKANSRSTTRLLLRPDPVILSGAYLFSKDLAFETDWLPIEIKTRHTPNGDINDFFNLVRFGIGFRYQTPVRVQFREIGTRFCISSKFCLDQSSFTLGHGYGSDSTDFEYYGLKGKATALCGDIGIGFIQRKSIFQLSSPYLAVELGYRFSRFTEFTTKLHGRETVLKSAYDGKTVGFDPSGWFITVVRLL